MSDDIHDQAGDFLPGDDILFVDEKDRQYLAPVPTEPQRKVHLRGEGFGPEELMRLRDGGLLVTPMRRRYLVFRPTLQEIVMNMPRAAQVIYPKDLATLLEWGDVAPGQSVAEVGCGHGALTMTLLRAVGPNGRLKSFDLRRDHLNRTRKNIEQFLGEEAAQRWEQEVADPTQEPLSGGPFDRLFSDMPEPWALLPSAAGGLRAGAVWAAYVPTVMQMGKLIEALNADPAFCMAQGFETMQRFWHVRGLSVRPKHNMKAHTGFIVTCRRRWREDSPVPAPQDESADVPSYE